jgi:hypothetical protein
LRFLFAKIRVDECYGDVTPTSQGTPLAIAERGDGLGIDFAAEVLGELLDTFELVSHVSGDRPMISLADSRWNGSGQGGEFVRVLLQLGSVDGFLGLLRRWNVLLGSGPSLLSGSLTGRDRDPSRDRDLTSLWDSGLSKQQDG